MSIGRITRQFPAYPGMRITVKDSQGMPARLYADAAGLAPLPDLGFITANAAGAVDFYVNDGRSYTLEVWFNGVMLDKQSGIDAEVPSGMSPTGRGTLPVGTSRTLTAADNGLTLECTATITLSVPTGLPDGFTCNVIPSGTTSIASLGAVALLNGATTTVTRVAATAANAVFSIVKRASAANSFVVSGA